MEESTSNFGIFRKKTKKGLVPYILHFDFHSNSICFARKGKAKQRNKIAFYKIFKVASSETHPHLFSLEIVDPDTNQINSFTCFAQTSVSRDKIITVLQNIVSCIRARKSIFPLAPNITSIAYTSSFLHYEGRVEKRGKVKWAERWLILNDIKLVVFRTKEDDYPLNIIELNYATVELLSEVVFRVNCLDRNYDFKVSSSYERDAWFKKIFKETEGNSQKLQPIKHMLGIKKGGKKLHKAHSLGDSGSDTGSENTDSEHYENINYHQFSDSPSSFTAREREGDRTRGGCRFCFGLPSSEGSTCFYCHSSYSPSSVGDITSSSSDSATSEDLSNNYSLPTPKAPHILDNFSAIHDLLAQPGPGLKFYLSNSKFAIALPAFVAATPSKSQFFRPPQIRVDIPHVLSKPVSISPSERELNKSFSTNSLHDLLKLKPALPSHSILANSLVKAASNEAISSSPVYSNRDSPVSPPVKSKAVAFINRGKRVDTPIHPPSVSDKPKERPLSPTSLKTRSNNNSPSPLYNIPKSDEFFSKALPSPLPPLSLSPPSSPSLSSPTPSTESVNLLLAKTCTTDWLRSPSSFASPPVSSSPPSIPCSLPVAMVRKFSDNDLSSSVFSTACIPKHRPEHIRLDSPPSFSKPKKNPPPPPKPPSKKFSIDIRNSPPLPLVKGGIPPPPPPPPLPKRSWGTLPTYHKLKLIECQPWMLPDDSPQLPSSQNLERRRSEPIIPSLILAKRQGRAIKSLPIIKIGCTPNPKQRKRIGSIETKSNEEGEKDHDGTEGTSKRNSRPRSHRLSTTPRSSTPPLIPHNNSSESLPEISEGGSESEWESGSEAESDVEFGASPSLSLLMPHFVLHNRPLSPDPNNSYHHQKSLHELNEDNLKVDSGQLEFQNTTIVDSIYNPCISPLTLSCSAPATLSLSATLSSDFLVESPELDLAIQPIELSQPTRASEIPRIMISDTKECNKLNANDNSDLNINTSPLSKLSTITKFKKGIRKTEVLDPFVQQQMMELQKKALEQDLNAPRSPRHTSPPTSPPTSPRDISSPHDIQQKNKMPNIFQRQNMLKKKKSVTHFELPPHLNQSSTVTRPPSSSSPSPPVMPRLQNKAFLSAQRKSVYEDIDKDKATDGGHQHKFVQRQPQQKIQMIQNKVMQQQSLHDQNQTQQSDNIKTRNAAAAFLRKIAHPRLSKSSDGITNPSPTTPILNPLPIHASAPQTIPLSSSSPSLMLSSSPFLSISPASPTLNPQSDPGNAWQPSTPRKNIPEIPSSNIQQISPPVPQPKGPVNFFAKQKQFHNFPSTV